MIVNHIKEIYRKCKWAVIYLLTFGGVSRLRYIDPATVIMGQMADSQFSANNTYLFIREGTWDKKTLPIEEHLLYVSYRMHFIENRPWMDTPFYQKALEDIDNKGAFRGEYVDVQSLNRRFMKCDLLFHSIKSHGYRSNHELYYQGDVRNILSRLDEVTINVSRDGAFILNDGWHRFITARLLGIDSIPVRILVRHPRSFFKVKPTWPIL